MDEYRRQRDLFLLDLSEEVGLPEETLRSLWERAGARRRAPAGKAAEETLRYWCLQEGMAARGRSAAQMRKSLGPPPLPPVIRKVSRGKKRELQGVPVGDGLLELEGLVYDCALGAVVRSSAGKLTEQDLEKAASMGLRCASLEFAESIQAESAQTRFCSLLKEAEEEQRKRSDRRDRGRQ